MNSYAHKIREGARRLLTAPVDMASLAVFRCLFGLMMTAAMVRFLARGWVTQFYIEPAFHFTYPGFSWVTPWPGHGMYAHFVILSLLGLGMALGFYYRICTLLFFLGFTYVELLDQTAYLNHYYLISLMSGLMLFLPANRLWSVDAWRKPSIRQATAPAWTLNLLRFQVGVVYFFAGLAKVNADWLLRAEPLRLWLSAKSCLPVVGSWLNEVWVAYAASWFGALFDLGIVFFLLHPRTRRAAYVLLLGFHAATGLLFNIGMFPWIMVVGATLFFPADWPRRWLLKRVGLLSLIYRGPPRVGQATDERAKAPCPTPPLSNGKTSGWIWVLLGLYVTVQLLLPLRSYFYADPPAWTGMGFNCAWRVMIAEKTGCVDFYTLNPTTGRRERLAGKDCLTPRQEMMMAQDPDLIRAFARRLSSELQTPGGATAPIYAESFATMNGRPSQRLIDPAVNLAGRLSSGWILPLKD